MHEMSLAQAVLAEAERCLTPYGPCARVVRVKVQVGALRAVVPEALTFCFHVVAQETPAEDAVLDIEEIPLRTRCHRCGHEWLPDGVTFFCPLCDGPVEVLTGMELLLHSLQIDDGGDA